MLPHQERVVSEKKELDEKLEKLGDFLNSSMFHSLDQSEKDRLNRQFLYMELYNQVLAERIRAF